MGSVPSVKCEYNNCCPVYNTTTTITLKLKGAVARKQKLFKLELRNDVPKYMLEFNIGETIAHATSCMHTHMHHVLMYALNLGLILL